MSTSQINNSVFSGKSIGLVSGVVAFLLVILFFHPEQTNNEITYTAAIAALMAIWWITEAIPLAVTALLPIILFPMFGIMNGKSVSGEYINHVIFLFIGGFIVAISVQKWNLHKRIALITLLIFGTKPRQIILGFMVATAFLSMWMSNTATAMMMVPIALSVIVNMESQTEKMNKFDLVLLLSIAYSASIGGIATLVGTPPNLVFVKIFAIVFPQAPEISFAKWFLFAAPISMIFLIIAWLFLSLTVRNVKIPLNKQILKEQLKKLGKTSYEEKLILVVFISLVFSWMFRADIQFGDFRFKGWTNLFGKPEFINDGTIAVFYSVLLFILPAKKEKRIMEWKDTIDLPWNIVLLFGGGFALASGFVESGFSVWLGEQFTILQNWHPVLIILMVCLIISLLTELTSNTATSQIILPILAPLSLTIHVNPLLLMIPVTLASSLAFMMPVATPPNAIVFGTNRIKIKQMIRYGFLLNMVGVVLVTIGILLFGHLLGVDLQTFPTWAK